MYPFHIRAFDKAHQLFPYLLLCALLTLLMLTLLVVGLDLGFVGDVLAYEYHYEHLGIQGGMSWLVREHWHRHLLGALYSAPIHFFFPGQSALWYGIALFTHLVNGLASFILADTWLRGQYRWLSFAAALLFVVNTLDVSSNFEYPTNTHRNFALFLSLISLWSYLRYIRGNRQNPWWHHVSLVSYIIGFMSYEQTTLLFLIFPLIAYSEESSTERIGKNWFVRVASDIVLYPLAVILYIYLLWILFPESSDSRNLSLPTLSKQLSEGLTLLFGPSTLWFRSTPAFQQAGLTLAIGLVIFLIMWLWMQKKKMTL